MLTLALALARLRECAKARLECAARKRSAKTPRATLLATLPVAPAPFLRRSASRVALARERRVMCRAVCPGACKVILPHYLPGQPADDNWKRETRPAETRPAAEPTSARRDEGGSIQDRRNVNQAGASRGERESFVGRKRRSFAGGKFCGREVLRAKEVFGTSVRGSKQGALQDGTR